LVGAKVISKRLETGGVLGFELDEWMKLPEVVNVILLGMRNPWTTGEETDEFIKWVPCPQDRDAEEKEESEDSDASLEYVESKGEKKTGKKGGRKGKAKAMKAKAKSVDTVEENLDAGKKKAAH
jgi:hypothetical protein